MYQLLRSKVPNEFLNNIHSKSNNIFPIKNVRGILNSNQLENIKYFCTGSHFDIFDTTYFETIYYTEINGKIKLIILLLKSIPLRIQICIFFNTLLFFL